MACSRTLTQTNMLRRRPLFTKAEATRSQAAKGVGMAGEGPPPPGRVTLDSVPKSLRTYDKGLRVRAVYFDFGVMTRTIEMEEAAVGTHLVSGFDPVREEFLYIYSLLLVVVSL